MSLNNGSNTSADVYYAEHDKGIRASTFSSSVAAMVAPSHKGRVGVPVLTVGKSGFRAEFGAPDLKLTVAHIQAEQFFTEGSQLYFVRVANNARYGSARITTLNGFAVANPSNVGYSDPEEYAFNDEDILFINGVDQGAWNNDIEVMVYPDTFDPANELFVVDVFYGNSQVAVESFRCTLREQTNGYGQQTGIQHQLNSSKYIRARVNYDHPKLKSFPEMRLINSLVRVGLSHGSNGDPVTIDQIIDAWDEYEDPEDIQVTMLLNSGYAIPAVQHKMLQIAEDRGDCLAILDVPREMQTTQKAVEYRRNVLNANTSFGALYSPDVAVRTEDNVQVLIPPSGYIAAVYARTDRVAAEWFAPAGITRGKVAADGLSQTYLQGDRDVLDVNQINFIHKMPGTGLVVWSQETLQSHASPLSNIHVRRLLNTLQVTIRGVSMMSLFEQNDPTLWVELREAATNVLAPVKRGRGLYGYEVICDESNNPVEYQASGDTVLDVYLDVMMVTKRIHLNANIVRRGQIEFAISLLDRN